MYIVLAERTFSETIRGLEGLDSSVTVEEIEHHLPRYYVKLAKYLKNYGIEILSGGEVRGTLFTTQARLTHAWDDESAATRVEGLAILNPLSVSLECGDVPAFVYDGMMQAAIQDQFGAFAAQLQRIAPYEIRSRLEDIARQILSAPIHTPENDFQRELQESEYENFLLAAGKGKQLKIEQRRRELDAAEQRQIEAYALASHHDPFPEDSD